MIATIVHIEVRPESIDSFIRVTTDNHFESVKEQGNLRFDLLRNSEYPNRFVLYEAYQNEAQAAAHKKTAHYLKWKETVAPWMTRQRVGLHYKALQPEI